MTSLSANTKTLGYVAASAIAMAMIAGCTGSAHLAKAGTYGARDASGGKQSGGKGVTAAERAVERSPQNATLRAGLGLAYLQAGRFASATARAPRSAWRSPRSAQGAAAKQSPFLMIGATPFRPAILALLWPWPARAPAVLPF
jgi:hypothetical protein